MQPIAYLNGSFIAADRASIPVTDWGFLQGITIAEQLRTFRGIPFRFDQHMHRLQQGLEIVQWPQPLTSADLREAVHKVVAHNYRLLPSQEDLGITIFVTPGTYPTYATSTNRAGATVCVHTYALPFHLWADKYDRGQVLVTVDTCQVPAECWPAALKCRSRMHYYLAQQAATRLRPQSSPLLLNMDGTVSETPTANLAAFYSGEGIAVPPACRVLPGVSMSMLHDLGREMGITVFERELRLADLLRADELFVTSTPFCMLPVSQLNDDCYRCPGPIYARFLTAWSESVQLDIRQQALDMVQR